MAIEAAARVTREQFENVDPAGDGLRDRLWVATFATSGRIEQAFEGIRHSTDTSKFNGLTDIRGSMSAKSDGGIHVPEIVFRW